MERSNVVDFSAMRVLRESNETIARMYEDAQGSLQNALARDVTRLDGRQLRELRDNIQYFRRIILTCSPDGRRLIDQIVKERRNQEQQEINAACEAALDSILHQQRIVFSVV